jgi:hypothetical protein
MTVNQVSVTTFHWRHFWRWVAAAHIFYLVMNHYSSITVARHLTRINLSSPVNLSGVKSGNSL